MPLKRLVEKPSRAIAWQVTRDEPIPDWARPHVSWSKNTDGALMVKGARGTMRAIVGQWIVCWTDGPRWTKRAVRLEVYSQRDLDLYFDEEA